MMIEPDIVRWLLLFNTWVVTVTCRVKKIERRKDCFWWFPSLGSGFLFSDAHRLLGRLHFSGDLSYICSSYLILKHIILGLIIEWFCIYILLKFSINHCNLVWCLAWFDQFVILMDPSVLFVIFVLVVIYHVARDGQVPTLLTRGFGLLHLW